MNFLSSITKQVENKQQLNHSMNSSGANKLQNLVMGSSQQNTDYIQSNLKIKKSQSIYHNKQQEENQEEEEEEEEYIKPSVYCLYHKDQLVNSICLDNHCSEKALCYQCELHAPQGEHHSIGLTQFCDKLLEFINIKNNDSEQFNTDIMTIVDGTNNNIKMEYFQKKAKESQESFHQQHQQQIEEMMDTFVQDIIKMVTRSKEEILQLYTKQSQHLFSTQSLHDKTFKNRACKVIKSTLKQGEFYQINQNIRKLHQGQYEVAFAREKIIKIFTQMKEKIQNFIQKTDTMVNQELQHFESFFKQFEKGQNLQKAAIFKRAQYNKHVRNTQNKGNNDLNNSNFGQKINLNSIPNFNKINENFQQSIKKVSNEQGNTQLLSSTVKNYMRQVSNAETPLKQINTPQKNLNQQLNSQNSYFFSKTILQSSKSTNNILSKTQQFNNLGDLSYRNLYQLNSPQNNTNNSNLSNNNNILNNSYQQNYNLAQENLSHQIQKQLKDDLLQTHGFFGDQISDIVKFQENIIAISLKSGVFTILEKPNENNEYQYYKKKKIEQDKNNQQEFKSTPQHQLKQIFQCQAHSAMGIIRPFQQGQLMFSSGSTKALQISLKLWSCYTSLNFHEHIEMLDMHTRQIIDIQILKEDSFTRERSKTVVNFVQFCTLGEDNMIKVWGLDYESSDFQRNRLAKLSQLQIGSKNVQRLYPFQNALFLHNDQFLVKIDIDSEGTVNVYKTIKLQATDKLVGVHFGDKKIQMITQNGYIHSYNNKLEKTCKTYDFFKKQLGSRPKHVFIGNQISTKTLKMFEFEGIQSQFFLQIKKEQEVFLLSYDFELETILQEKQYFSENIQNILVFQDQRFITIENGVELKFWQPFNR